MTIRLLFVVFCCVLTIDVRAEIASQLSAEIGAAGTLTATEVVTLVEATDLRYDKNQILELLATLPVGTRLRLPANYEVQHLNFRKADGTIDWSSTGFIASVEIISVPPGATAQFPAEVIAKLNQTAGGLYIFDSIVGAIEGVGGEFAVMVPATEGDGYLQNYQANGRPKNSFATSLKKRFGKNLNHAIDANTLAPAEREKWQAIYTEIRRAVDRTVANPKSILMIDPQVAKEKSIEFEQNGVISPNGAWSIATEGTAVRHGFANVPCAEFMSEVIREAYQRSGYAVTKDFSSDKGNALIWSSSASVAALSLALNTAGWVPWDATLYRPPVGAIMMDGAGQTPGHTYASAGLDGRFIVDNGSPQGRDLGKTVLKTINMMYQTGVFFLPPGIVPEKW